MGGGEQNVVLACPCALDEGPEIARAVDDDAPMQAFFKRVSQRLIQRDDLTRSEIGENTEAERRPFGQRRTRQRHACHGEQAEA